MTTQQELDVALAFAALEIREVQAGKRTLGQCPGLKEVAKAIATYEAGAFNRTYDANARRRKQYE